MKRVLFATLFATWSLTSAVADDQPTINNHRAHQLFEFSLIYNADFSAMNSLDDAKDLLRREDMGVSNNAGQHRQGPGRRHAAWYDQHHSKTALVERGELVQRGFVADSDLEGFRSRDAGDSPRNFAYTDPDPKDASKGEVNFADFEIHTSWFDTFALKSVDGKQVPVERSDIQVPKDQYWGQTGKTDTASPNIVFHPGTFFEIEVNFEGMEALAHRHSFWLMPASEQHLAYDDNPANGLEIDIYEHEMVAEADSTEAESRNNILLMKCIGGQTTPPTTFNELRDDGKTSIEVPGINEGWHKIGLFWDQKSLIWFVDGKAVVKDSRLVPTVPMYLIVSREANTGAGLSADHQNLKADGNRIPVDAGLYGRNAATPKNRDLIKQGRDEVRVKTIRAWRIAPSP